MPYKTLLVECGSYWNCHMFLHSCLQYFIGIDMCQWQYHLWIFTAISLSVVAIVIALVFVILCIILIIIIIRLKGRLSLCVSFNVSLLFCIWLVLISGNDTGCYVKFIYRKFCGINLCIIIWLISSSWITRGHCTYVYVVAQSWVPCGLSAVGQIVNQDANKLGSNAYHEDSVAKKQPHQELQLQEPNSPVYYSNTLDNDDDDGMYEYVSEADLQRPGKH